jgi:hypothetical protein
MARFARVIALGVPHHITQRGNARRFILDSDADRKVYLDLLRQSAERCRPVGSAEFLRAVEGQTKRRLALQKGGPKPAADPGKRQGTFSFGA